MPFQWYILRAFSVTGPYKRAMGFVFGMLHNLSHALKTIYYNGENTRGFQRKLENLAQDRISGQPISIEIHDQIDQIFAEKT